LKRLLPSFTVEIRRQQKRAPTSANLRWVQTTPALIAFSDKQLSSTATEIRKVDAPVAEPGAPRPSGRILPDLSEIDLRSNRGVEASSSNAETRGRKFTPMTDAGQIGRPRGRPRTSTSENAAPMADRPIPPESPAGGRLGGSSSIATPSPPSMPPASTASVDNVSATNVRVTRRDKAPTFSESPQGPPSREALRPLLPADAPSAQTPPVPEESRGDRRQKILGRFIFGGELKPGERWKRRLPKCALR
jgi:hypothetical protein